MTDHLHLGRRAGWERRRGVRTGKWNIIKSYQILLPLWHEALSAKLVLAVWKLYFEEAKNIWGMSVWFFFLSKGIFSVKKGFQLVSKIWEKSLFMRLRISEGYSVKRGHDYPTKVLQRRLVTKRRVPGMKQGCYHQSSILWLWLLVDDVIVIAISSSVS